MGKCPATYLVRPSKASGWILLILLSYNVNLVTCILNHNCNQGQTECQIFSSNRGACQKLFCGFFPLRGYCISSFNSLLFLIYFHKVRLNERLMLVVWELAVIMHNLRIYPKPPSLFVKMVKRMARTESMITRFRR